MGPLSVDEADDLVHSNPVDDHPISTAVVLFPKGQKCIRSMKKIVVDFKAVDKKCTSMHQAFDLMCCSQSKFGQLACRSWIAS